MSESKALTVGADQDIRMTPAQRAEIQRIRAENAYTMAVTAESWGDRMAPQTRRAFAEFVRRFHLDVSEVDNLGGRPYRNGYYYRRRIAGMRTAGLVEWSEGDVIGPNERLDAMAEAGDEWAKDERTRRIRERIRMAVPTDASHAYVVRVKLKGDGKPLEGVDWITPGRVKRVKEWKNRQFIGMKDVCADPVGEAEPEHTVETRAWRRVGLLAAAEIPELQQSEREMESAADMIEGQAEEIEQEAERVNEQASFPPNGRALVGAGSDPYGLANDRAPAAVSAEPVSQTPNGEEEPEWFRSAGEDDDLAAIR